MPEYKSLELLGKLALNEIKGGLVQNNSVYKNYVNGKHLTEESLGLSISKENEFKKGFKNPTE